MRYVSTRDSSGEPGRPFCDILLEGLAPDGGLYLPESYPDVDAETLERWRSATDHLPSLDRSVDPRLADLTEALRSARTQQRTEMDPVASFELQRRSEPGTGP